MLNNTKKKKEIKENHCQILLARGQKLLADMHGWLAHGWSRRYPDYLVCGCVWWFLSVCFSVGTSFQMSCALFFSVLCAPSPFPCPPPDPHEGSGDSMPMVWNSACASAALQSAGFWVGALSPLPLFPSLPHPVLPSLSNSACLFYLLK